jgi:hypothetical protein
MERDHLEDREEDGRITKGCFLKVYDMRMRGWMELAQDRMKCKL